MDVPNASTEPDEKKVRGLPITYAELGGVLAQDVEDRRGFALGGVVSKIVELSEGDDKDEVIKHLTKEIRKAEPIFEADDIVSVYSRSEAAEFAENVTEEAVRYMDSDKVSDLDEALQYSQNIGMKVTTKPKKSGGKKIKHKGRLRLVRPLDIGTVSEGLLTGSGFLKILKSNPDLQKEVITGSPVDNEDASRVIKKLINDYTDTEKLINGFSKQPTEVTQPLLDIKESIRLRETLSDLGYDSIKYNNNEYIIFDNNQFRVTKRLRLAVGGLATALGKTVTGKQRSSKRLRKSYLDPAYLDSLKPKSTRSATQSKFNLSAREVYDLLTDGQITITEAEDYLKDYGYRKETIKKIVRPFKEVNYAKGNDFVTYRSKFTEGGEVNKEEDSFKLFGKDGFIFDPTNPLDYAMLIPGVGVVGWGAKAVSSASKASKALKTFPKTVYHGGQQFDKMRFGKIEKPVYTEGLHRDKFADEISAVYTSADPKYAAGYMERFRSLRTKDHGILDHMKIDDPKVQRLRGPEVKAQIEKYGYPGFMKIDISDVKPKQIYFWDKPTKDMKKKIDQAIEVERNRKKTEAGIDPLASNIRIGELKQLKDYKKLSIDDPTYFPNISLFQRNFLRENNIRLISKSTHADNVSLQQFAKAKGKSEPSEYILIDEFPVKKLTPQEKETAIQSYEQLMKEFSQMYKEFLDHLELREGNVEYVYLDSLDKPTCGVGHLLTEHECSVYELGQKVSKSIRDKWLDQDAQKAWSAALKQLKDLDIDELEFAVALGSVNFQLGTRWMDKFPSAYKALKNKDYDEAIKQVSTGSGKDGQSKWKEQTPVRVKDFVTALDKLK